MKNKNIRKNILNIIIFLIFAILTISIVFKKNNMTEIFLNIKQVNITYIIFAIISMFIFISCEGINIRRVLQTLVQLRHLLVEEIQLNFIL